MLGDDDGLLRHALRELDGLIGRTGARAVRWAGAHYTWPDIALAEQGNAVAQERLGEMYTDGKGVPQNYGEAAKWYRLAADQGYAGAQTNLGSMYERGTGVPQNHVEAVK